jgi:hypothetical protein
LTHCVDARILFACMGLSIFSLTGEKPMSRSILLVAMLSLIAFAQAETTRRDKADVPITYRLCNPGLKECSIVVKRMSDLSPDMRRETRDALRILPSGGEEGDSQCHWVDTTLFCWTNDIKGNCGCVFVPGAYHCAGDHPGCPTQ